MDKSIAAKEAPLTLKKRELPDKDKNKAAFVDEENRLKVHLGVYALPNPKIIGADGKRGVGSETLWLAEDTITFSKDKKATRMYKNAAHAIFGTNTGDLIKIYSFNCKKYSCDGEFILTCPTVATWNSRVYASDYDTEQRCMDVFASGHSETPDRCYHHVIVDNYSELRSKFPMMLASRVMQEKQVSTTSSGACLQVAENTELFKAITFKISIGELKPVKHVEEVGYMIPMTTKDGSQNGNDVFNAVMRDLESKIVCIDPETLHIKAVATPGVGAGRLTVVFGFIYAVVSKD